MGSSGSVGGVYKSSAESSLIRVEKGKGNLREKGSGFVGAVSVPNVTGGIATKAGSKNGKTVELHTQNATYTMKNAKFTVDNKGNVKFESHPNVKAGYKGNNNKGQPIIHTRGVATGSARQRSYAKEHATVTKKYMKQGMKQSEAKKAATKYIKDKYKNMSTKDKQATSSQKGSESQKTSGGRKSNMEYNGKKDINELLKKYG